MKIIRGGKYYEVLEASEDGKNVKVESLFEFAQPPYMRNLEMWWSLEDCEKIEQ